MSTFVLLTLTWTKALLYPMEIIRDNLKRAQEAMLYIFEKWVWG